MKYTRSKFDRKCKRTIKSLPLNHAYIAINEKLQRAINDKKLNEALRDTFPASDPVARY